MDKKNLNKGFVKNSDGDVVSIRKKKKNLGGISTRKHVRKEANMFDDIRFPDDMCEGNGVYELAPNSKEYIEVKQNYDRTSFHFHRPRVGQVCDFAKASEGTCSH